MVTLDSNHQVVMISGRQCKRSHRNKLWRARARYRESEDKATRVVRHMHYTVAHNLCRNYERIALPFTSSQYWRRGDKLNKMVKRRSMMLSFGKFRQRLKETSTWYTRVSITGGSESSTSKQCGACGTLNDKLVGSEVFKCCSCGKKADRDVHAARNILLRFLDD